MFVNREGVRGLAWDQSPLALPMSNVPPPPAPPDAPQSWRRIHPGYLAVVLLVAAVGLGYVAARAIALPQPAPVEAAGRLKIDVVQPVEPRILPGDTMEVGDMENGFRYVPPSRQTVETARYESVEEPPRLPEPPPRPRPTPEWEQPSPPEREARPPTEDRWFGFDLPGRDYRAEREARRARREAREERAYDQDRTRDADRARHDAEAQERRRAWSDLEYPPDSAT